MLWDIIIFFTLLPGFLNCDHISALHNVIAKYTPFSSKSSTTWIQKLWSRTHLIDHSLELAAQFTQDYKACIHPVVPLIGSFDLLHILCLWILKESFCMLKSVDSTLMRKCKRIFLLKDFLNWVRILHIFALLFRWKLLGDLTVGDEIWRGWFESRAGSLDRMRNLLFDEWIQHIGVKYQSNLRKHFICDLWNHQSKGAASQQECS